MFILVIGTFSQILSHLLFAESTLASGIENMFIKMSDSIVFFLFSVFTGMFPLPLVQR